MSVWKGTPDEFTLYSLVHTYVVVKCYNYKVGSSFKFWFVVSLGDHYIFDLM